MGQMDLAPGAPEKAEFLEASSALRKTLWRQERLAEVHCHTYAGENGKRGWYEKFFSASGGFSGQCPEFLAEQREMENWSESPRDNNEVRSLLLRATALREKWRLAAGAALGAPSRQARALSL